MNNPVMMLSTPAAVGFQVLKGMQPIVSGRRPDVVRRKDRIRVIRESDIHHPPGDCCNGPRRLASARSAMLAWIWRAWLISPARLVTHHANRG